MVLIEGRFSHSPAIRAVVDSPYILASPTSVSYQESQSPSRESLSDFIVSPSCRLFNQTTGCLFADTIDGRRHADPVQPIPGRQFERARHAGFQKLGTIDR